MDTVARPKVRGPLSALLGFLSVTALIGGAALVIRPDGSLLGMGTDMLATSVFRDFRWPGILLFTVFGIGGSIALFAVRRDERYAGRLAMTIGAGQVIWIMVQLVMIDKPSFLQPTLLAIGAAIAGLAARLNGPRKAKGSTTGHPAS